MTKGPVRIALDAEIRQRAGCLGLRRVRSTGTTVGMYKTGPADIDSELPYATVCETHSAIVCHATRADALRSMSRPDQWCDACRGEPDESV